MEKHNLKRTLSIVAGSLVVALVVSILPGNFFASAEELSKDEAEQIALEKLIEFEEVDEDTLVSILTSKVTPRNNDPYYSIIIKTKDGEYDLTVSAKNGEFKIENKLTEEEAIEKAKEKIAEKFDVDKDELEAEVDDKHANDRRRPYYTIILEDDESRVFKVKVYVYNGDVDFDFEITEEDAKKIAITRISKEYSVNRRNLAISNVDDTHADELRNPYYIVTIKDNEDNEYEVMVYINSGEAVITAEESEEVTESKNFEEFKEQIGAQRVESAKDLEKFNLDNDKYDNYDDKKTPEASLNMLLKDGKKAAIADFKESGNKEEFKKAKEILKAIKKNEKIDIKEVKKGNEDNDRDDKSSLLKNTILSEKQALIVALKKIEYPNLDNYLRRLNSEDINTEKAYSKLLGLKELDIEKDDENPPAYEFEFIFENIKYEITVHARTGRILEFEAEEIKNTKKEVKSNEKDDDKNIKENNNNKNKNINNNDQKTKSNNGKGNNK